MASRDTKTFVEDSTWVAQFDHSANNKTHICLKAGSKDYALKAGTDEDRRGSLTELQLKKRYS